MIIGPSSRATATLGGKGEGTLGGKGMREMAGHKSSGVGDAHNPSVEQGDGGGIVQRAKGPTQENALCHAVRACRNARFWSGEETHGRAVDVVVAVLDRSLHNDAFS